MGMKKFLLGLIGIVCALFAVPSWGACNLFDMDWLLNAPNWTKNGDVYSGPADSMWSTYAGGGQHFPMTFATNTQYTFSGHVGANPANARFSIIYTDGTDYKLFFGIDGDFSYTSSAGKTISRVVFGNAANGNIQLSNIQVEEGTTATAYTPYNPLCATCDGTVHSGQWNQLVQNGNFADGVNNWTSESGVVANAENGVLSVTYQSSGDRGVGQVVEIGSGHKVFVSFDVDSYTGKSYIGVFRGSNSASMFRSLGDAVEINKTGHYEQVRTLTALSSGFDYYAAGAGRPVEEGVKVSFSNLNVIDLTEMFGAGNEPSTEQEAKAAIAQRANELGISATNNYYAYHANENVSYCISKIKVASTKYVETEFSALNTALANAVATVNTVVTQTIAQAASIATLQSGKQTRPDETCPAGKKCLLVTDENNIPHWYEIVEPLLPAGYIQLQWIESTGTQYIDTGIKPSTTSFAYDVSFSPVNGGSAIIGNQRNDILVYLNYSNTLEIYHNGTEHTYLATGLQTNIFYNVQVSYNNSSYTATFDGSRQITGTNVNITPNYNWLLFANTNSGTATDRGNLKMSVAKIWNNGELVGNFIPAKRNSDGAIGMYDMVGGRFYENAGTGTFIGGQPVFN